jgi:hypothetical protein
VRVELTERGSLLIPAEVSAACFDHAPSVLVGGVEGELRVVAIGARAVGGLILKQRNARGDRAVLVSEQLPAHWDPGEREATWDAEERTLRVPLVLASGGAG